MTRILPLLGLSACIVPGGAFPLDPTDELNGLRARVVPSWLAGGPEPSDTGLDDTADTSTGEERHWQSLRVHLDEVVFTASLEDRAMAVSDGENLWLDLATGAGTGDVPTLLLPRGQYEDATHTLRFAAFSFAAVVDGQPIAAEGEEPWRWTGESDAFVMPEGADPATTFEVATGEWLADLDVEDATVVDGVVRISATENIEIYETLVEQLQDVEGRFPEGIGAE